MYDDNDKDKDIGEIFFTFKIPDTLEIMILLVMVMSILATPNITKVH